MPRTMLGKTRKTENPYATFQRGDWEWRLLKTYKAAENERTDQYARWFVAAKSDHTFGRFEMGDTYRTEVLQYGRLVSCDPAFAEAYKSDPALGPQIAALKVEA